MQMYYEVFMKRHEDEFQALAIDDTINEKRSQGEDIWLLDDSKRRIAVVVQDVNENEDSFFEISNKRDEDSGEEIIELSYNKGEINLDEAPKKFRAQMINS